MPAELTGSLVSLSVNTIRGLSIDGVQRANSGHPGMPLGCAAMAYALFARHLVFDADAPNWFNRDRFILSAGHGSMLLYSLLHLTGYGVSIEDLKNFRQFGSITPGHPENHLTPGVEMATGPLGQGFATGVGMAIAEEKLRHEFPGVVEHWTYAICSDGDLMEGVSHESASLAGHLKLGRLIYLYDSNRITIDGSTDLSFSENVQMRFESYGWHVLECDGMDVDEVDVAISDAKRDSRPSLIICHTTIGFGSPNKAGKSSSHGSPLGIEEAKLTKAALGIPLEPEFYVSDDVRNHFLEIGKRSRQNRIESEKKLNDYPDLKRRFSNELPENWASELPIFKEAMATRAASGKILNLLAESLPELMGGSADLAESNNTTLHAYESFLFGNRDGRNVNYGIREFAMGCAINGMTLHGGVRAYGGTFLIFSDYMRPSVRLSSLMEISSIFVFSHDSIGLGEDGPTHQPIEHLMSLRAIPHLKVFRPADGNEAIAGWKIALESKDSPTALILTRQKVDALPPRIDDALKGAYVVFEPDAKPDCLLIGTGSEVQICLKAKDLLTSQGVHARVVSMPCWELFEIQSEKYKNSIFAEEIENRVSVEAGATLGWSKWVGPKGTAIGIDQFGASAPAEVIYEKYGLTAEKVVEAVFRFRE